MLEALPAALTLIADRGYDSAWFRQELEARGIEPCGPSKSRKKHYPYDKALYRPCHKVENLLAKLKDWRRVGNRSNRHVPELTNEPLTLDASERRL